LRGRSLNVLADGVTPDNEKVDLSFIERFDTAMNDDLNTPEAMSLLHELAGTLNRENNVTSERSHELATTLKIMGGRLGILMQDPEVALQGGRDFARSDEIRDELAELGIVLEDAGGKTTWRRQ